MIDCEHCIYGNKVNWAELPPQYECLNDGFEESWLREDDYCQGYTERPSRYDVKLGEV